MPSFENHDLHVLQNIALFLVITAEPEKDFGTLIRAQALGDYEALIDVKRKVVRIHLPSVKDVKRVVESLD